MNTNRSKKISALVLGFALLFITACQSEKEYIGGNIIHIALTDQTWHTDRVPSPFSYNTTTSNLLYRKLFIAEGSFYNLKNDLAQSHSVSSDSLVYTIKMKEGQKWSDGEEITLDDFLFTIDTLQNVKRPYQPIILHALNEITDISVNGYEIKFTLEQPLFNFLPMLAQIPLLPKHKLEHLPYDLRDEEINFWQNPVTSGLYKVQSITPNEVIELTRNENFTGTAAKIEQVNFYFKQGHVALDKFSTNDIAEITQYRAMRQKYDELPVDVLFFRYLVFNMQGDDGYVNPNMQDKRLREAICYAIDNVGITENIYFESAEIAKNLTQDTSNFLVYNPEKSKEIIAEINYDLSKPLRLAYYYKDETSAAVMRHLQRNLEDVGFSVELVFTDSHDAIYKDRNFDILYKGLPPFSRHEWYNEYSRANSTASKLIDTNGTFDELLDQLAQSADSKAAQEVLNELNEKDRDMLYKFIIYQPMHSCYINKERVKLPKNVTFLNPWYKSSTDFANWEIKKK